MSRGRTVCTMGDLVSTTPRGNTRPFAESHFRLTLASVVALNVRVVAVEVPQAISIAMRRKQVAESHPIPGSHVRLGVALAGRRRLPCSERREIGQLQQTILM